jgi:hypothetical protein
MNLSESLYMSSYTQSEAYFARGGLSAEVSACFGSLEGLLVSGGRAEAEADAAAVAAAAAVPRVPELEKIPAGNPLTNS